MGRANSRTEGVKESSETTEKVLILLKSVYKYTSDCLRSMEQTHPTSATDVRCAHH